MNLRPIDLFFVFFCSWRSEVHNVNCDSSGPDCVPPPYRQEGSRDFEGSASYWKVSSQISVETLQRSEDRAENVVIYKPLAAGI